MTKQGRVCEKVDNYKIKVGLIEKFTIIRDIWNLEAFAAVDLISLKLDPKFARTRGEGNGSLVGLTSLVRGYGRGQRWRKCGESLGPSLRNHLTQSIATHKISPCHDF